MLSSDLSLFSYSNFPASYPILTHFLFYSVSSPSKIQADDVSTSGEDVKEREDFEIIRVFDGNNSYRSQVSVQ